MRTESRVPGRCQQHNSEGGQAVQRQAMEHRGQGDRRAGCPDPAVGQGGSQPRGEDARTVGSLSLICELCSASRIAWTVAR